MTIAPNNKPNTTFDLMFSIMRFMLIRFGRCSSKAASHSWLWEARVQRLHALGSQSDYDPIYLARTT
jgi:hypothetical protein